MFLTPMRRARSNETSEFLIKIFFFWRHLEKCSQFCYLCIYIQNCGLRPSQCRYWAKFRLKVGKVKQLIKAAVVGPAFDRCKRRHWPNNNSRLLAAEIGPILCRIISFGISLLGVYLLFLHRKI